jgi:hypothetical protein
MALPTSSNQLSREQRDWPKELLAAATALLDSMDKSVRVSCADVAKYSSYKEYARKYVDLLDAICKVIRVAAVVDRYNVEAMPGVYDTTVFRQKEYFDSVHANLSILKAYLESRLDVKTGEISGLKDFFQAHLRRAVFAPPKREKDIQEVVEQLLIGRGYTKGEDYDRETGRVKVSIKESVPDFIFPKLNMALEVKLSKDQNRSKEIVDEMNADIQAYGMKYASILFVVYDLSSIQDEAEFRRGLESPDGVSVVVVKH